MTRAVRSVLAQSFRALEVIVVVDGPDEPTLEALRAVADARLRVHALPARLGIGGARNAGVQAARGAWVAFLDDDDEWFPAKLERQLQVAETSTHALPIVASRLLARSETGEHVWPRRLPEAGECLDDYLLTRKGPFWGETLVHTSTLLTRRELALRIPFDPALSRHEDLDWLLRAVRVEGAGLEFVPHPEPLAVWHTDVNRPRVSITPDWRFSFAWIRARRQIVSQRAYAGFLLTWVSSDAAREGSREALWGLPWEAFRRGRPTACDMLLYLGIWLVPQPARRQLCGLPAGIRRCAGWKFRRRGPAAAPGYHP